MSSGIAGTVDNYGSGKIHVHGHVNEVRDNSSNEISSFTVCYVLTCNISYYVVTLITDFLPEQYQLLGNLVLCFYLSVGLSSMLMFNNWLVKEPVTQNPFKLVYSVVRYAIKHKHPECMSAFTYCEDEPPRIDFGKSKYGGPFTTEQVENVRTFLQFIITMIAESIVYIYIIAIFTSILHTVKVLEMLTGTMHKSLLTHYT